MIVILYQIFCKTRDHRSTNVRPNHISALVYVFVWLSLKMEIQQGQILNQRDMKKDKLHEQIGSKK